MSKPALWATSTAPRANSRNIGSTASMVGASETIADVMPVSCTICGGMSRPGSTSVANSPSTTPPRTLTAPISVISSPPGGRWPVRRWSPDPPPRTWSRPASSPQAGGAPTAVGSTSAKLSCSMDVTLGSGTDRSVLRTCRCVSLASRAGRQRRRLSTTAPCAVRRGLQGLCGQCADRHAGPIRRPAARPLCARTNARRLEALADAGLAPRLRLVPIHRREDPRRCLTHCCEDATSKIASY